MIFDATEATPHKKLVCKGVEDATLPKENCPIKKSL